MPKPTARDLPSNADELIRVGFKAALTAHAVWENGEQCVGSERTPLLRALESVDARSNNYYESLIAFAHKCTQ